MGLIETYRQTVLTKSDINEHLPVLLRYGNLCNSITEMGVRTGRSTLAWLMIPNIRLTCYDLKIHKNLPLNIYEEWAAQQNIDFLFIEGDTREVIIGEVDLLFIDTLHVYEQLREELRLHGNKAKKYIILHDTETFGQVGELKNHRGLQFAIDEFLGDHPWKVKEVLKNNNGLTILERK